jgi:hypothetical protein
MSAETHRVEIEIGENCFASLRSEAERLGVEVEQIVQRATSAWLNDIHEGAVSLAPAVPRG